MKQGAWLFGAALLLVFISATAFATGDRVMHAAIHITNDYEFTVENGVCSGAGTLDDPYVIEGWEIDAGYDDYGIRIHGTTRAFVIRNVEIAGAAKSAIYLSYVRNGIIENCIFEGNWVGVTLNFSTLNRISACTFSDNTDGVRLYFSSSNQILVSTFTKNDSGVWLDASNTNELVGNYIGDCHMGVYLNLDSEENTIVGNAFVDNTHHAYSDDPNIWDDGASGNYWSGFRAIDADEDGIWDSPFRISAEGDQDNYPMKTHPLVPAPPPASCDI